METEKLIPMQFQSSCGTLSVNEDGSIHEESDLDDWLLNIGTVDIEELDNYYEINNLSLCEGGDVLDFGYWDKQGTYHKPEKSWRIDMFHNQDFNEEEVKQVVEQSYEWISKNR